MLRALLVRAAAGSLVAAVAISCSHEDPPAEKVGQVEQLAAVGGAGGAPDILPDAGAPADGGAPVVGSGGAGGAGGDASPPYVCGQNDCQGACEHCVGNVCEPQPSTHECRPASGGECDAPETCDGVNPTCPTEEKYQLPGTFCGNAADPLLGCDVQDVCTGTSKACPNTVKPKETAISCRPKQGDCDLDDFCDGVSASCKDDKWQSDHPCRFVDPKDLCDLPDFCDGKSNDCKDTFKSSNITCRDSIQGSDSCDPPEFCTGNAAACPGDVRLDNNTSCAAASSNKCAATAECQNGLCIVSQEKTCRPADDCKKAETCNTNTGFCEVQFEMDGKTCSDGVVCSTGDRCVKGVCTPTAADSKLCPERDCAAVFCDLSATNLPDRCRYDAPFAKGLVCRKAESFCDIADTCNGVDLDCPVEDKRKPIGTVCVAGVCGNNEMQPEVTCDGSAFCSSVPKVSCDGYGCDAKVCKTSCDTSADCITSYYCLDHVCEKRVDAGKPCEQDGECASGSFCVDGVCCNTQCKGQCEACNLEGKEGVCELVTGDPVGDRTPCKGDGSACNGSCDGTKRGQCTFPTVQTQCQDAACDATSGMAVEQAFCDGAGNCAATDPTDCAPYLCGATACRGDCVSDAQCVSGSFCKAGKCIPLSEPGTACARDAQCASGFCADGVCCDSRCDGQCEACGKSGACEAVSGAPVGNRPACAGDDGDDCAGSCDGVKRTSCSYPGASVACRDASCDAGVATVAAHCSGDGRCAEPQTVTCPNGCEGVLCAGDACSVSTDCKEGERCIAGTCAPQGDDGVVCASGADCGSGFCVDGVCCDRACDGQCEACDGKKPGVCAAVSGEPHGSRPSCTSDGSACGGSCDGKNALGCSYPSGTVCAAGSCELGQDGGEAVATVESQCNGSGRCPAQREQACGSVGCDAAEQECDGDCADGSACGDGKYCSAGVCVDDLPTGDACQSADQCASGFCVDGYCCGSACDETCAACDVAGSLGKCVPVSGPTHGGRNACRGAGACGATCDGKSVTDCAFADEDTSCGDAYCQAGVQVAASACDGAGQCRAGESLACASLACDGTECSDACTADADCSRSLQCREGKCVEPFLINAVDEGTCGCRAPGGAPSRGATWLASLAVAALVVARRRSRRAA